MYPLNWLFAMSFASLGISLLIKINVIFDASAKVCIATSPSVRGLTIEAATLDEIKTETALALPELLALNHVDKTLHEPAKIKQQLVLAL